MKRTKEEFEKDFLSLYNQGKSVTEICKILDEDRRRGYKFIYSKGFKNHSSPLKKYSLEFLLVIKEEYLSGLTIKEIHEKHPEYNISSINSHLRKMGLTRPNHTRIKCKNPNYFDNIDTPQKAYFLGLFYADGTVLKICSKEKERFKICLELTEEDKYILEKLNQELNASNKIGIRFSRTNKIKDKKANSKNSCYVSYSNQELYNGLIKLGVNNKKEKRSSLPKIPDEFMRYFILGLFDGDGIASSGKKWYIGFCGQYSLMDDLGTYLKKELNIRKGKIYTRGNISYIGYYSKKDKTNLFHYLYDDVKCVFLKRKFKKLKQNIS